MTFGYLAQPIDQAAGTGRAAGRLNRLVGLAQNLAADSQIDLFQPATAYRLAGANLVEGTASAIDTINSTSLAMAEILFAVLPSKVPTLGTVVEIERALARGLPTVIITDLLGQSVQVQSWAQHGATVIYEHADLDYMDACRAVRAVLRTPRQPVSLATGRPTDLLPYVRTHEAASVPTKAYEDDAGLDLAACEPAVIPARGSAQVRTGLKFALPPGTWGLIIGRSSAWAKKGLDVRLAVIDVGWRGELFVVCYNPTDTDYKVEVGERLAQYILLPAWLGHLAEVEELPAHDRGENGFGSSGH